jgi:hypothetical protein
MKTWNKLLHFAAVCAALVGGAGELAMLQHWRLRERLRPRLPR